MEIEFFGANCFRITTKKTVILVDDNLSKIGRKSVQSEKTTVFYTSKTLIDETSAIKSKLMLDSPGEYEVGDVTVIGVQARAHTDTENHESSTVFQFMKDSQTITVLGHIHPDISVAVSELIGGTDVLIVPVGGNGFTLDPTGALKVIKKVEPSVVIPSQYDIKGLNYEVPAQPLEEFGKLPTITLEDPIDSFKLESNTEENVVQTKIITLNVKSK
jgi:L-ascorbate metabolism protein UlaG (beta-lactamase superfamily)